MTERTHVAEFNEELLSGYLDGALVQQDEQRVRVHLEGSAEARELLRQLVEIREAAIETKFPENRDYQWSEAPRGAASSISRRLGFLLFGAWTVALIGYSLWQMARSDEPLFAKLLVAGVVSGAALLLLSAVIDRLKVAKDDPYRGVEK